MFDIRNYAWNVFEISRALEIRNLYDALDMMLVNVELGQPRYKGATQVNYFDLMKRVCKTPKNKRLDQRALFRSCLDRNSKELFKAWKDQDRERFEQICTNDIIMFKSATQRR